MGDFENKYAKLSAANQEKVKDYCRTLKLAEERKAQLAKKTVEKEKPAGEGGRAWVRIACETETRIEKHAFLTTTEVYEKVLNLLFDLTED